MKTESRAGDRKRLLAWLAVTVALGLVSRKLPIGLHVWDKALGDGLYAAMVYLIMALLAPGARRSSIALGGLGFCAAIELFQLTGIPMQVARTPLRWLLGTTFAWEDLAYYVLGTAGIYLLDARFGGARRQDERSFSSAESPKTSPGSS